MKQKDCSVDQLGILKADIDAMGSTVNVNTFWFLWLEYGFPHLTKVSQSSYSVQLHSLAQPYNLKKKKGRKEKTTPLNWIFIRLPKVYLIIINNS